MIKRKVIVEIGYRGVNTLEENSYIADEIREWLENRGRNNPYFGDCKDKLTVIYEEETP